MGSIIKMNSEEFFDFMDNYDYREFHFLLISQDIKTLGNYRNVFSLNTLIPPPNILTLYVADGYTKKYAKKYKNYLKNESVEPLIATIVQMAAVNDTNVVLLCSKEAESKYKYIDLIGEFIEDEYDVKVCSYKKFKKKPKEKDVSDKKEKVSEIIKSKLNGFDIDTTSTKIDYKGFKKEINNLDKKTLISYCDDINIKIKPSWNRKKIVNKVLTELFPKEHK